MPENTPARPRSLLLVPVLLLSLMAALLLYGTPAAHAADPLQAEAATLTGGTRAESEHSGYTGSGYVGGYTDGNKGSATTAFAVTAPTAGSGSVKLRYANGTTATMTLSLYVNGTRTGRLSLPATANWATWSTLDAPVDYRQGANTVALVFTADDSGNINLDSLTPTTPSEGGGGSLTHEAEDAFFSGGPEKSTSTSGYQGSGYLDRFTTNGSRAVFSVRSAAATEHDVQVRYRTSDAGNATVSLTANGSPLRQLTLPGTSGSWQTVTTSTPLRAGLNTVTLRTESGDNGAFQLDGLDIPTAAANATRGATLPYTAYEAETGTTNATTIGPDRAYLQVPSEASGRRAVVLDATGEYVEFTLTKPASALTLRYSIPDSTDGAGIDRSLSLYADGTHLRDLGLTSKYSWVYGAYPYDNDPSGGSPHRFFDETRAVIGDFPAGTKLRLQKDAGDTAASYTLDLIETETAPAAYTMPSGFVSATGLGVTADDGTDDTAALNSAVSTATSQGKGLWLPKGTYNISGHLDLIGATVRGAGEWHTVVRGKDNKGGFFGRGGTSTIQDLMFAGDATHRDDAGGHTAIEGDFGNGSTVQNVWIEHAKVGLWIDAPTNGLLATGLRIRDTFADGVNLHKGTKNSEVSHSSVRGTGDDGLAMFSEEQAVTDCVFRFNTVQLPMLANTAAIYGGSGNRIEDNLLSDTVNASAGIAISTRNFPPAPLPFSGPTTVARNTLERTGGYEANWGAKLGAVWVYADHSDITTPVRIVGNDILDSTYSGLLVSWQKTVGDLTVEDTRIDRTGAYGIEINAAGAGTFSGVAVSGTKDGGLSLAGGFRITRGAGNSGW
ncbi:carbohydrate-binding protein [Streptomyces sp. TRM66268-LWL]|uniref:Carbohydrate-binding protein n=1 Tax=Streptomyces polyasparticus TaxID=2767826 RepID=A0ABR7SJL8_9ACTN|nr:CBM35 domain-containing protein [Streptomyces polyasparticus]MBC9715044.1 carbohydrate-binding protein [Streptomyces polyasparticus]